MPAPGARALPVELVPLLPAFRELAARHRIRLLILFGSRARGAGIPPRPDSDYDFGVLFGRGAAVPGPDDLRRLSHELQHLLRTDRVDLAVLDRASPLLQYEAARSGIPLVEAYPGAFAEYCVRSLQRHEDARDFYQAERAYLERRLAGPADAPQAHG